MKKIIKWFAIVVTVCFLFLLIVGTIGNSMPTTTDTQVPTKTKPTNMPSPTAVPTKVEPTNIPSPTAVPTVKKAESFNIEITNLIVKKVNNKYRYFFDIRNKDNKPFEGEVKISLYKSNMKLGYDAFKTNRPIEPNLGNYVYVEANTGPVSQMGVNGMTDYRYEVMINKQTVKTGEGKITDKFENLE